MLTTYLRLARRLRISGAILLPHQHALTAWTGTVFTFPPLIV